jgi:hypothetical protein
MDRATRRRAESFWASRLACPEALLREPGLHLRPSTNSTTIFVVSFGASVFAVAPSDLHEKLAKTLRPDELPAPKSFWIESPISVWRHIPLTAAVGWRVASSGQRHPR